MVTEDAESQAPRTRTNQKERESSTNRRQPKRTGHYSRTIRSESISSSRTDRQGTNTLNYSGDVLTGGTIQQLITETLAEIQEIDDRREKLCKRVTDLRDLLKGLQNPEENSE
ncbi:MAG: hypothetical protein HWQ41_19330 [Nostoc sp. NOS(2021)]|uniref:hypothetical protein n=1 Tax=Nostoc sp. NOS(2021) TaxID=2815407 RepID=UPI0025D7FA1E|nr:hypothetical protein [Nostoc sp. NOS(2021)]MBN3897348.1 hypothetical protein [Nostoc sp. NOS(2021)]